MQRERLDRVEMFDFAEFSAIVDVPRLHKPVDAAGDNDVSVPGGGQRADCPGGADARQFPAGLEVPDPRGGVVAPGNEPLPVVGEQYSLHRCGMTFERPDGAARAGVEDVDQGIVTAGDNLSAV